MKEEKVNIFDQLYNRLQIRANGFITRVEEKYLGDQAKITAAKKNIQTDLENDLNKLKIIIEALQKDKSKQESFIKMMIYITDFKEEGITENGILDAILGYGVLQMKFPNTLEKLDDETAYLLTTIMSRFNASDFDFYGIMVTDQKLLESVMKKSPNMNDRREIMDEVCYFFEECDLDGLTSEEYSNYLEKSLKIVEEISIGQNNKESKI